MIRELGKSGPDHAWDGRSDRLVDGLPTVLGPDHGFVGAFGGVYGRPDGGWQLARDPLGLAKVFWAPHDGKLLVAGDPFRLVAEGAPFEEVRALPPGTNVEFGRHRPPPDPGNRAAADGAPFATGGGRPRDLEIVARAIRERLDGYLEAVRGTYAGGRIFVCLSGGIDSTAIAILARDHFPDLVLVSFDLHRRGGAPSEDRSTARRVADELASPLLEVETSADGLLERLDEVLVTAIDWRDFNVHAALVNAVLADGIREAVPGDRPTVVLTGDLANEYLADYSPEHIGGVESYPLPRVPLPALRRSLVRGLDTSHREVGPFWAVGLPLVQPFAAAHAEFMELPAAFLEMADRKQRLAAAVTGHRLPRYVLERTKVRAQVGGGDGGVLATFIASGIRGTDLEARFARLHRAPVASVRRFIRGGLYRAAVPSAELAGSAYEEART